MALVPWPAVKGAVIAQRSWRALDLASEVTKGGNLHPEPLKARSAT